VVRLKTFSLQGPRLTTILACRVTILACRERSFHFKNLASDSFEKAEYTIFVTAVSGSVAFCLDIADRLESLENDRQCDAVQQRKRFSVTLVKIVQIKPSPSKCIDQVRI
jgi:hypothetical protein